MVTSLIYRWPLYLNQFSLDKSLLVFTPQFNSKMYLMCSHQDMILGAEREGDPQDPIDSFCC